MFEWGRNGYQIMHSGHSAECAVHGSSFQMHEAKVESQVEGVGKWGGHEDRALKEWDYYLQKQTTENPLPFHNKTSIEKRCLKCFVSTQSSLAVPRPAQHQEWKEVNSDFKSYQNIILYNSRNK